MLAQGDGQRGDVAPSIGRVVIPRDLVVQGRHHVGGLAAGDVKHVVGAESCLEGITGRRLIGTGLPCDRAAAGRSRRWRAGGHTEVVLLDGIGRSRNVRSNRPERSFPRLSRVPFRLRERNRPHGDQQEQVKHASDKMGFNVGFDLFFHKLGFASAAVRFLSMRKVTGVVVD